MCLVSPHDILEFENSLKNSVAIQKSLVSIDVNVHSR